jgi:hypothetical protein
MHVAELTRHTAHGKRTGLPVDEHAARAVAACYLASDDRSADPLVRAAYQQLEAQTDHLLQRLVRAWPGGLRLVSTALESPYGSDDDLLVAVPTTGTLEIPRVARSRRHPLLGNSPGGPYDRFRAVHDLLGHVHHRFGFDRDGEFAAWLAQDRHHHGLARWALATELHAQHSVLWSTGELAEPKATLIDTRILRASAPRLVTPLVAGPLRPASRHKRRPHPFGTLGPRRRDGRATSTPEGATWGKAVDGVIRAVEVDQPERTAEASSSPSS